MYAEVLVEIKAKAIEKTFTYKVPDNLDLKEGERVLVPFGKRIIKCHVRQDKNDFARTW